MDTDDLPTEALIGATIGSAITILVMNPKVRNTTRRGVVWTLGKLLIAKDTAHAVIKDWIKDAGVSSSEADRMASTVENVMEETASTSLGT